MCPELSLRFSPGHIASPSGPVSFRRWARVNFHKWAKTSCQTQTGKVTGKTARRHTSADFIAFLTDVVQQTKWAQEIHIVLDNLSAHKTKAVEEFLQQNPRVRFHFTPTYSSWLNQVELWFAKIQRDVIDRGVFTSVNDLARKLRRYIRAYENSARPFRWTYTDPQRRIKANVITGTSHWCKASCTPRESEMSGRGLETDESPFPFHTFMRLSNFLHDRGWSSRWKAATDCAHRRGWRNPDLRNVPSMGAANWRSGRRNEKFARHEWENVFTLMMLACSSALHKPWREPLFAPIN